MAFLTMSMYSDVLQMDTNVSVILPENRKGGMDAYAPDKKYPVLYCLHGHGDDHTAWIRKSNIELIVREYEIVVVMPTTQRGFYVDNYYGLDYYTYMSRELPLKMENFFPISNRREDHFVIGNSMGGYGALRIVMANPDQYAGAASLSGACMISESGDNEMRQVMGDKFLQHRQQVFGPDEIFQGSDNNLCNLVRKLNEYDGTQPLLYQCCGTEDNLILNQHRAFCAYVEKHGERLHYLHEESSGGHNWSYWNPQIQKVFDLFGLKKTKQMQWN